MQQRLANREKELASVKQLFIEKLRLLESSFADLGEVLPQIQKEQLDKQREDKLQKYISDDVNDQTVQELTAENSELHDKINELKSQMKENSLEEK
jgi:hypothetical protein